MRCKECKCYPENGGQYGGLDHRNLCSYCALKKDNEEKREKKTNQ